MPKRIRIITAIIVGLIALGAAAIYITLRQGGEEVRRQEEVATTTEESLVQPEELVPQSEEPTTTEPIDTSDWKTYTNEEYGFEVRYPSHLQIQRTLFDQPFNPGLEGLIIATFSDERTDELVIAASQRSSLDGYIVRDEPGGVYYRFDEIKDRWISSVRGEVTGGEPKLLDVPVTAYGYRSGDGKCSWHGAVVPHPTEDYVFEFIFVSCADEGQQPRPLGPIPDLTPILTTFKELTLSKAANTSNWKTYTNKEYGFEIKYPSTWIKEEGKDYVGFRTSKHLLFGTPALISKIEIYPLYKRSLANYVDEEASKCNIPFWLGEKVINGLRRKELRITKYGLSYFDVICFNAEYGHEDRYIYFKSGGHVISLSFFGLSETLTDIIIHNFSLLKNEVR